jgi:hypothetical protein
MDAKDLKELLRHPMVAGIIIALISALAIYFFPSNGLYIIVVVVAFLISEGISELFIRGGSGILQIRFLGARAQPKGYGLIALFLSVILTSWLIDVLTDTLAINITVWFSDIGKDLLIGLGLAVGVYVDMYMRFYRHED